MAWFKRKNEKEEDSKQSLEKVAVKAAAKIAIAEEIAVVVPEKIAGAGNVGAIKYFVKPAVTEKGTLVGQYRTYVFLVRPAATKPAIKQAVEKLYGVRVIAVRTLQQKPKTVHFGGRSGKRSALKKAYVTVAKGQTITVVKGV